MKLSRKQILDAIDAMQIIQREEVEITKSENDSDEIKPPMTELINLTDDQITRLQGEVFKHFEALAQDRKELEKDWEANECGYEGIVEPEPNMEFALNMPIIQVKCDAVERLAIKAFLESDPKFVCDLRPEAMRESMEVGALEKSAKNQEEYLDYVMDERINIASPLRKIFHQSVALDVGIMKIPYSYKRKRRVREEFYSGKMIGSGQARPDSEEEIMIPEGLEEFLKNYPKATVPGEEGHTQFKQLVQGKDIKFNASFIETVEDDPKPTFVDLRNFYVRKSCEGYDGLCNEQIYIERVPYTYWEMQKAEENEEMINVEKIKYSGINDKGELTGEIENYEIKEHNTLEVTYYFKMNKDDKEETRIICKFGEHNKVFLGACEYPYNNVESIYLPFYIFDKKPGFYKGCLTDKLRDSNIAQNSILNMMLTETWLDLVTTPIVKEGSTLADQLLSHNFSSGVPLTIGADESLNESIGYLQKPEKNVAAQLIHVLLFMGRMDDDRTGVNSGLSGKENPLDPRAPAAKTAMLLKQSGINVSEYVDVLATSFNKAGEIILRLTYQMSNSGRKFRGKQRAKKVSGTEMFSEISRDDMILETVIQTRAASFAFDKSIEKQENTLLFKLLRNDPMIARNPKSIHNLVKTLLESWSPTWKAKADKLVLSNEDFNEEVVKLGLQALNVYMNELTKQAKITGAQPNANIKEYLGLVTQMMAQTYNPQPEGAENEAGLAA